MSETKLIPYEYSIIRYYHDTSTHEFLNIGVALYSSELDYFKAQIATKYKRITSTFFNADGRNYQSYVKKLNYRFIKISKNELNSQGNLFGNDTKNLEDLLRIHMKRESSFRYSQPSNGIAQNNIQGLEQTFIHLYKTYVEKYIVKKEKYSRDSEEVWKGVYQPKIMTMGNRIIKKIVPTFIETPYDTLEYDYSFRNGSFHLIEPISFDMVSPSYIKTIAHKQLGRNVLLNNGADISHLYLLLGKPINKGKDVLKSYEIAKKIINSNGIGYKYNRVIIEEDGADDFASHMKSLIEKTL